MKACLLVLAAIGIVIVSGAAATPMPGIPPNPLASKRQIDAEMRSTFALALIAAALGFIAGLFW